MFGQDPHAVYEAIERLHGSLCCYRELRAKYRERAHRAAPPVATACASPPTVGPPAAPAPPSPQPPPTATFSAPTVGWPAAPAPAVAATVPRPEAPPSAPSTAERATSASTAPTSPILGVPGLDDSLIVGFCAVKGRRVPVYADPGDCSGVAPNTDASVIPRAPTAAQATSPSPDPPPPAAHAAAPRAQNAATTLSLDPPTPPPIVREVDHTTPIERVLAEHRALAAEQARVADERHAAVLRDLLAEHRQALAAADERHRVELAELLAQHRAELREVSARNDDAAKATADLRELLAEQARASAEQNACLGDMIATLVETVSRIALARATPRAPIFIPPPLRVVPPVDGDPTPAQSGEVSSTTTPSPVATPAPSSSPASDGNPASPAIPTPSARAAAASAGGSTAPATRPAPPTPPQGVSTPAAASSSAGPVPSRGSSLLAIVTEIASELEPDRSTPRQLRAQAEARDRQRMYEAVDECADDSEFMADTSDEPEAMEGPRA